jgi:hypothetical protein
MKKILITCFALLALVSSAMATGLAVVPYPIVSSPSYPGTIQMFAPNGTTTTTLTVASKTVDLTNYIMFSVESGSGTTCNVRLMPTSAKGAYAQTVLRVAGTRFDRAKNSATPFVNFSGCTGGSYSLQ